MNGSQEPKIGPCLVETFRFLKESILYLVVFGANIPMSEGFKATRVALLVDQIVYNHRFFAKIPQHIVDCSFNNDWLSVVVNGLPEMAKGN